MATTTDKETVNVRSFKTAPQLIQLSNSAPIQCVLGFSAPDLGAIDFEKAEKMAAGARIGVSIPIGSIEGFLQGLKISNPVQQKEVFLLSGKEAKHAVKDVELDPDGGIFFLGKRFDRCSLPHRALIEFSIWRKCFEDETSREALLWTGSATITRNLGKFDAKPGKTTLPKQVFTRMLTEIREALRQEEPVGRSFQQIYAGLLVNRLAENYWYLSEPERLSCPCVSIPDQLIMK